MELKNSNLSLIIRSLGAKIVSLKYKNKELVYLSTKLPKHPKLPIPGDTFDARSAWGGDICAPTVSKCSFTPLGCKRKKMKCGDHGDFWTKEFKFKKITKSSVTLIGESKEFILKVKFILKNKTLIRNYKITNKTKYKLPFTFADHLILPVQTDIAPEKYLNLNTDKLTVWWSYRDKLGKQETVVKWPLVRQRPFADKLFGRLKKQKNLFSVAYITNYSSSPAEQDEKFQDSSSHPVQRDSNNKIQIELSSKDLPFLGYWQTEGGWNEQYNLGLELTNTDADDLSIAAKKGTVWWIVPGKSRKWSIQLSIKN